MKRSVALLLVGFVVCLPLVVKAGDKSAKGTQPVYVLTRTTDSIAWRWGDQRGVVPFSEMGKFDTSRVGYSHSIWLISGGDSIEVTPTSEAAKVWIVSAKDTAIETMIFVSEQSGDEVDTAKIALLRQYQTYDSSPAPDSIQFDYLSPADSELTILRTRYNLDSVAGGGDEFSRMTNLLHWLHFRLRHDGSVNLPNPDPYTTTNILAVAAKEGRPFHCGILAHTMVDVFLSMGVKTRPIVCMPYDTADHECHQLALAWSKQYSKWILIDPTFDMWFSDSAGVPLNPIEVRKAMANGDSLRLADCINWNGQARSKRDHSNYMAKNLFLFKSWGTRIDPASGKQQVIVVWLVPKGYNGHDLGSIRAGATANQLECYTDNIDWFFAPPK